MVGDTINEVPHYFLFLICDLETYYGYTLKWDGSHPPTLDPASVNSEFMGAILIFTTPQRGDYSRGGATIQGNTVYQKSII